LCIEYHSLSGDGCSICTGCPFEFLKDSENDEGCMAFIQRICKQKRVPDLLGTAVSIRCGGITIINPELYLKECKKVVKAAFKEIQFV